MNIEKIRKLNDQLCKTFIGGKVQEFDNFTEDNDPYHEHDFGAINFKNETYFWKIDYYDLDYLCLSPDISDENVTNRVLTIMRGDEY